MNNFTKYLDHIWVGTLFLVLALPCTAQPTTGVDLNAAYAKSKAAINDPTWSIARVWNEGILFAIRRDTARPVVHARNLFHLSVVMWDAWSAYTDAGEQYLHQERLSAADVPAARREAISYASYRLLVERFKNSPGKLVTLPHLDAIMVELGYDVGVTTTVGDTPAALGNRIAAEALAIWLDDGANEANNYAANNGYLPINDPLVVKLGGLNYMADPNHWQPLALDFFVDQGGIVLGPYPAFIGPHWGGVTPFSLKPWDARETTWLDPGPQPRIHTETEDLFKAEAIEVIQLTSELTPDDGITMDISPSVRGNAPLGTNNYAGHALNPYTGQPYAANEVKRGDFARVLAEFWADGPNSETPPGHWNVVANYSTDRMVELGMPLRLGAEGPEFDRLEWDVKLYLALDGAMHDAAVVAWGIKGHYDGARPISMIRYLCTLGQSSDPELPSYDPAGIPLVPGLIELITNESSAPGERHAHLAGHVGEIALVCWLNAPADPVNQYTGVGWILGTSWIPYQRPTFVTPPFAGYVSGHSTYSRAGAEVLTRFTGSEFFPGGMGVFHAEQNQYLVFEDGPSESVDLQWATYYDAADQSGNSRLWGGIHVRADDFTGRRLGAYIGASAYGWAEQYFDGTKSIHNADSDADGKISLTELLRIIQFYNIGGLHVEAGTEDGYGTGPGDTTSRPPHESDYNPPDWHISLEEVLRCIQFYNVGNYHYCGDSEDTFCMNEVSP